MDLREFLREAESAAERERIEAEVAAGRLPETALAGQLRIVNEEAVRRGEGEALVVRRPFRDSAAWAAYHGRKS